MSAHECRRPDHWGPLEPGEPAACGQTTTSRFPLCDACDARRSRFVTAKIARYIESGAFGRHLSGRPNSTIIDFYREGN